MDILKFDLTKKYGGFKPMNAVNNGPVHKDSGGQHRSNLNEFRDACIPYVRNHDASFCQYYGSEHSVDITAVFPNFDADPNLAESYDFACTDEYLRLIDLTGAKTFYRLGQKIEHYVKKFGTIPPKDFKKWAVVCEHIIRHYNEGWANGFNLGIEYWEIWNEPDLAAEKPPTRTTWGGTSEQFFDLYETTAKHLKECFPNLKIGGPALAWIESWGNEFLSEMHKRNVPIDFFSWHMYTNDPVAMTGKINRIKKILVDNGYTDTESILNEWNYIKNWQDLFTYSIESIIGIKGAAFNMACMSEAQKAPVDMLMYYDARPCAFNGVFDFYTLRPLKGYYPFLWFSKFYGLEEIRSENAVDDIYTLCGTDENGKIKAVVTYYTDDECMPNKTVKLDFGKNPEFKLFVLDDEKTNEYVGISKNLQLSLKPNSCIFIEEI